MDAVTKYLAEEYQVLRAEVLVILAIVVFAGYLAHSLNLFAKK